MTKEDRDRAQARADKATKAAQDARSGKAERDASAKAVLDNMAKLKALRLAREAAEPQRAPAARTAKKARASTKRPDEKPVALSDWLTSQQSGGRRTWAPTLKGGSSRPGQRARPHSRAFGPRV